MTDIIHAYTGEAMLIRWAENHNGRTVTLLLDDTIGEAHPFKHLKGGYTHGQRMQIAVVLVGDDEQPVPPKIGPVPAEDASQTSPDIAAPEGQDRVRRSWASLKPSQQCAIKLKEDQEFRDWLVKTYGVPGEPYPDVELLLKAQLGIASKTELDGDPVKAQSWERMLTSYDVRELMR